MSWDADLIGSAGAREWNYTHNCNRMIEAAIGAAIDGTDEPWWASTAACTGKRSWWRLLDGRSGTDGGELLSTIVTNLEADPDRFRAMNPDNGWGDYDRLLGVLREMRDASLSEPCATWSVAG